MSSPIRPSCMLLTGAPHPSTVTSKGLSPSDNRVINWDVSSPLLRQRLYRSSSPAAALSAWRELDPEPRKVPLNAECSATEADESLKEDYDISFFSHGDVIVDLKLLDSSQTRDDEIQQQFHHHSVSLHESMLSSQATWSNESEESVQSASPQQSAITESFLSTCSEGDSLSSSHVKTLEALTALGPVESIIDLKSIPKASHIQRVLPGTLTENLIIGIVSVSAPRTIRTRKGHDMELLELFVGDETRAGFTINLWFPTADRSLNQQKARLKETAKGLRPRDVVLFRNVALSVFRGQVFGQSCWNLTKADLLQRTPADEIDNTGLVSSAVIEDCRSQVPWLRKTEKVIQWISRFVAAPIKNPSSREILPADTQSVIQID